MRISVERRTTLFIGTFGVLSALIIGVIIVPMTKRIRDLHNKTYELRLFLELKNERSQRLHHSLTTIRDLTVSTLPFENYLFQRGDELSLITLLETMAANHRVTQTVTNSNLDQPTRRTVDFTVSVTGAYRDAWSYFAALEHKLPYFAIIKRAQMVPGVNRLSPDDSGEIVTLIIDVRIYAQQQTTS